MIVITSRTFRESQKKYMDLATKERVVIKRHNEYLELVPRGTSIPENPSPSNDPYFDNPRNIEDILTGIEQCKQGKSVLLTPELQKQLFDL